MRQQYAAHRTHAVVCTTTSYSSQQCIVVDSYNHVSGYDYMNVCMYMFLLFTCGCTLYVRVTICNWMCVILYLEIGHRANTMCCILYTTLNYCTLSFVSDHQYHIQWKFISVDTFQLKQIYLNIAYVKWRPSYSCLTGIIRWFITVANGTFDIWWYFAFTTNR